MAFWAEIDEEYVLRFQEWHNCEHMPERLGIPGFREGRRYRATSGAPYFLMCYDTDSARVLGSEQYLRALNAPTPWTREALGHFLNPVRSVYELRAVAGEGGRLPAPYVTVVCFDDLGCESEGGLKTWIDGVVRIKGTRRVRVFKMDTELGRRRTAEKRIYGDAGGRHVCLGLVEQEARPESVLEELKDAGSGGGRLVADRVEYSCFWLEMAYKSAGLVDL